MKTYICYNRKKVEILKRLENGESGSFLAMGWGKKQKYLASREEKTAPGYKVSND